MLYFLLKRFSLSCLIRRPLNNSPFLGEKSCNQIFIPESQTRCWEHRLTEVCPIPPLPLLPPLSLAFIPHFFFHSLPEVRVPPPSSGCRWCSVSGNSDIDLEPRVEAHLKALGLFSQLHAGWGVKGW